MPNTRPIHPDFQYYLDFKEAKLIETYTALRDFMISCYPQSNELLYHTHALTSVYSLSPKLSDAFCMIPIYTNHLNLGFNKGTLLNDPDNLLQGTGKLIRHIPITSPADFKSKKVKNLVQAAIDLALEDLEEKNRKEGRCISKIKRT